MAMEITANTEILTFGTWHKKKLTTPSLIIRSDPLIIFLREKRKKGSASKEKNSK